MTKFDCLSLMHPADLWGLVVEYIGLDDPKELEVLLKLDATIQEIVFTQLKNVVARIRSETEKFSNTIRSIDRELDHSLIAKEGLWNMPPELLDAPHEMDAKAPTVQKLMEEISDSAARRDKVMHAGLIAIRASQVFFQKNASESNGLLPNLQVADVVVTTLTPAKRNHIHCWIMRPPLGGGRADDYRLDEMDFSPRRLKPLKEGDVAHWQIKDETWVVKLAQNKWSQYFSNFSSTLPAGPFETAVEKAQLKP